jgi:Capsular polysaccharide synthesis, CpsB/CapC
MTLPALRFKNRAPISTGRDDSTSEPVSFKLLDQSLVHVVATDARNPESRPPILSEARGAIRTRYSDELAKALSVTFPEARVSGTSFLHVFSPIGPIEYSPVTKHRSENPSILLRMSSSSCAGTFPARDWDFVDRATALRAENVLELNLVSSIGPQSPWHSEI